jgi:pimeloyl-ACP methyl ester carboxylesterase
VRSMQLLPVGIAVALAIVVALFLASVWLESRALTNPGGYRQPDPAEFVFTETPATEAGLSYEDIAFDVASGETVRGWLVPAAQDAKDVGIVALHGRSGDRRGQLGHLSMLNKLGAGVLLIDMRENGLSDGENRGMALGIREAEDAAAAAQELRARGYQKVVLFGCSLGGTTAILAAAQDPSIDAVISESAIARFEDFVAEGADRRLGLIGIGAKWATAWWAGLVVDHTHRRIGLSAYLAPADVIGNIAPRPVLLIHGLQDHWVAETHAQALKDKGGPNVDYWQIAEAGHCDGGAVAGEEYRARVAGLIEQVRAAPASSAR